MGGRGLIKLGVRQIETHVEGRRSFPHSVQFPLLC
jgi:hypothetical protein